MTDLPPNKGSSRIPAVKRSGLKDTVNDLLQAIAIVALVLVGVFSLLKFLG